MATVEVLKARGSLKRLGFLLDHRPIQIDRALLNSLSEEQRERIEDIWQARNMGFVSGLEQYEVPETPKQAAILFSHDWRRTALSNGWVSETLEKIAPTSVIDFGCGAGFLLRFLEERLPAVRAKGIETRENLAGIARQISSSEVEVGDYTKLEAQADFDCLVCNFGFDLPSLKMTSPPPHSSAQIGPEEFCPGCSDFLEPQLAPYFEGWKRWAGASAPLLLTGRIPGFGPLRAFVLAAQRSDWVLDLSMSTVLKLEQPDCEAEYFPALVFQDSSIGTAPPSMEDIANFYGSRLSS